MTNRVWGLCTAVSPPTHLPFLFLVRNCIVVLSGTELYTFIGTGVAIGYTFILEVDLKLKHINPQCKYFSYLKIFVCSSQRKYSQASLMIALILMRVYFIENNMRAYRVATGAEWGIL